VRPNATDILYSFAILHGTINDVTMPAANSFQSTNSSEKDVTSVAA
jgi:hypothetical protein